jgi:hypothetical protein
MKTFLTDLTAMPQQRSDHAFQQLRNAKQEEDLSLTVFAAHITNIAQGTQISDCDKRMFLCTWMRLETLTALPRCVEHPMVLRTWMRLETRTALPRGVEHPMFDALLEACLYVEADLRQEADFRKG